MLASVVVVGDEILSGHVQDANTHFIAVRLAHHGHRLRRAVVVGDDPAEIAREIAVDLEGEPALVFVCGGLGPTHDDRTMEGVAAALGVPLEPCADLRMQIDEVVNAVGRHGFEWDAFGIEGLRKMALAPPGATVLPCSIGVVPAVTIDDPRARLIVLPGPPRELQAVFLESVEPRFLEGTGEDLVREEIVHRFPESTLAEVLAALQQRFPEVALGSYPQRDHVLLRIAGSGPDVAAVAEHLRRHIETLAESPEGRRLLDVLSGFRASDSGGATSPP